MYFKRNNFKQKRPLKYEFNNTLTESLINLEGNYYDE